ncbi:MAG: type II toxin-antitoxin system RelE/ParE family toxin [Victivallaceae bacterium]
MEFIETNIFTKLADMLFTDSEYRELQFALLTNPTVGDLIQGSGGLRKVRWNVTTGGKRGGARIIYYWDAGNKIYMLYGYKKNKQSDLTSEQLKTLSKLVKEQLK